MSPSRLPQLGSVIWAEVEDANGFRKVRPAVVLTATADIAADKPLRVAAITTRLPTPLPETTYYCRGISRGKLAPDCVAGVRPWQRGTWKSRLGM